MDKPLQGVQVLEVAQFTFVPSAGAVLADWGADVIKIEHPETGDAQRGLVSVLGRAASVVDSSFFPIMEAPNRGKRSVGMSLTSPEARPHLEELIRRSDVFLTNYLPRSRAKLQIDIDTVRRINPDIIYAVGSGFGTQGPDQDRAAYDSTAFWARGGSADGVTPSNAERVAFMPAGAYGDNLGGLAIAAGVAGALYGRSVTGTSSVVDVSLLSVGAWATQFSINLALLAGGPLPKAESATNVPGNPLTGNYQTSDGRFVQLAMLQPLRFWPEFCALFDLGEAATDPRFGTMDSLAAHAPQAYDIVAGAIGSLTAAECVERLQQGTGAWALVQNGWDLGHDAALIANGRIVDIEDVDGRTQKLVANPVRFDDGSLRLTRAPQFAEHTDDVLRELGVSDEAIIELKIAGAVT
mgnify:CR=1 FL=1